MRKTSPLQFIRLEGYSKQTKRKRTRTYRVTNINEAIKRASAEDLVVDTSTIARIYPIKHFFTKVVGVTKDNDDHSSRQKIISGCHAGQVLGLIRDKQNRYSRHAVAVVRERGKQLGFLPDEVAFHVAQEMQEKCAHLCFIMGMGLVEADDMDDSVYGVSLLVLVADDLETDLKLIRDYIKSEIRPESGSTAPILQWIQREIDKG